MSVINDTIIHLRKEILPLQGFKHLGRKNPVDLGLGIIKNSFPDHSFPLGAIHEFICNHAEEVSATSGFMAGLLKGLMQDGGVCVWIGVSRTLFPPALAFYGIAPEKIIFIDLKKEKDLLWTMEEALKCDGLTAVVGEIPEISFTASRRLQLAVEQSRVTGLVLRRNPKNKITACVTRWKISSLPSQLPGNLPGVGFPRWNAELVKVRNGRPGSWHLEWREGKFHILPSLIAIVTEENRKTG